MDTFSMIDAELDPLVKPTITPEQARRDVAWLIASAAQENPKRGWQEAAEESDFRGKAMDKAYLATEIRAANFVAALEAVGMTRFDAVEIFTGAKAALRQSVPAPQKKSKGAK